MLYNMEFLWAKWRWRCIGLWLFFKTFITALRIHHLHILWIQIVKVLRDILLSSYCFLC